MGTMCGCVFVFGLFSGTPAIVDWEPLLHVVGNDALLRDDVANEFMLMVASLSGLTSSGKFPYCT
jgi:hypothetical protein